nr:YegP family protein [Flavobacterium sp. ASV13]
MEKFVINKNKNGEYLFDFINSEEEVILRSGAYTRKFMCIKGIESVKANSQEDLKFFRKKTPDNRRYFNLKAFNGRIIAMSTMFKDKISCDNEIEFFKTKALDAPIEDRSGNNKSGRKTRNIAIQVV